MNLVYYILIALATLLAIYFLFHLMIWLLLMIFAFPISTKKTYDKPSKLYSGLFNLAYWELLTQARVKIHVTGLEYLPEDTTFMFVSNHRSKFDNMVHSLVLHKYPLAFVSKKENFKIPIGKHFMTRCCYLSLDRGNLRQGVTIIDRATKLVADGSSSVGIFPEGTRSTDLQIRDFKPGTFRIAVNSNKPIVVGVTQGTENIHKNWPWKKSHVYFDIVKVLYPDDFKELSTVDIAKNVQNLVVQKIENQNN